MFVIKIANGSGFKELMEVFPQYTFQLYTVYLVSTIEASALYDTRCHTKKTMISSYITAQQLLEFEWKDKSIELITLISEL